MTQQQYCPVTRCQAITDIFESVAKEQEALADILDKATNKPSYGKYTECYSDYEDDRRSDKDKIDNQKQMELINAVTRLEFILAYKSSLFINCACPNGGCPERDKYDYK